MTQAGPPDIEVVREMSLKYRNWGRWGADDELGSLNFVTAEMRAQANTSHDKRGNANG